MNLGNDKSVFRTEDTTALFDSLSAIPTGFVGTARVGNQLYTFDGGNSLRNVATRCGRNDSFLGSLTTLMTKTEIPIRDNLSFLQVLIEAPINTTGTAVGTGTTTITASIEYPVNSGTFYRLTFNGSNSGSLVLGTIGNYLLSDKLIINIKNNDHVGLRIFQSNPNGSFYCVQGAGSQAPAWSDGANYPSATDLTMGGTISTDLTLFFKPSAILSISNKPSFILYGDSITYGTGDTINNSGYFGEERLIAPYYAVMNRGIAGDTLSTFNSTPNSWNVQLSAYASHVASFYGVNDVNALGADLPIFLASLQTFTALFPVKPVFISTLTPLFVTTSDAWATLANQTISNATKESRRQLINTQIRARLVTGMYGVIDTASIAESGVTGKWVVNGTSNFYTADGIHPTANMYNLFISNKIFTPPIG